MNMSRPSVYYCHSEGALHRAAPRRAQAATVFALHLAPRAAWRAAAHAAHAVYAEAPLRAAMPQKSIASFFTPKAGAAPARKRAAAGAARRERACTHRGRGDTRGCIFACV